MTTIKIAATAVTSKQVCAPSRELNADELALITGGTPSSAPNLTTGAHYTQAILYCR